VKDPPAGLDAHLLDAMAGQLGRAIVSFARVMDRAFAEARVAPPKTDVTLAGYLATLDIPIQWVLRKMEDANERAIVAAMYAEYEATGKVIRTLAHDDRIVRAAHAREVLQRPLSELDAEPARKPGALHGYRALTPVDAQEPLAQAPAAQPHRAAPAAHSVAEPAPVETSAPVGPPGGARSDADPQSKKRRTRENPIVDAPAIGTKIAARLEAIGIRTIGDLLDADPQAVANMLTQRWLNAQGVIDWQAMAQLAIDVQAVGEQDAQILIGAGIRDAAALAGLDARALQEKVDDFLASDAGKRTVRGASAPKAAKVEAWIEGARGAA
jgi:hypothetical protein